MSAVPEQIEEAHQGTEPHSEERAAALLELREALQLFSVEADVFVDVFARAHGLGRSDLNAIMWTARSASAGEPITAGELAAKLGLGASAATSLIDRLENAGHVRRKRDPADRRRVTVTMEDTAMAMAVAFFQPLGVRMAAKVAERSTADLQTAAEVVRAMTAAVTDARTATRKQ